MILRIAILILLVQSTGICQPLPTPEILVMQPFTSGWDVQHRSERVGEIRHKEAQTQFTLYINAPLSVDEDCFMPTCSVAGNELQIQLSKPCPDSGATGLVPIQFSWEVPVNFSKVRFNGKELPLTDDPFIITQPAPVFSTFDGDTINLTDIHGIRKGTWISFDADSNIVWEVVYHQNDIPTGFYRTYDDSGHLASRSFYVLGHVLQSRKLKEEFPYSEEFWNIGTQLPGFEKAECYFTPGGLLRRVKLYFYGGQIRVIE